MQLLLVLIGALEVEVNSADEALGWLEAGNTARVTAATHMNQRSSRSHAVFTLHIGEPSLLYVCTNSMNQTYQCYREANFLICTINTIGQVLIA